MPQNTSNKGAQTPVLGSKGQYVYGTAKEVKRNLKNTISFAEQALNAMRRGDEVLTRDAVEYMGIAAGQATEELEEYLLTR